MSDDIIAYLISRLLNAAEESSEEMKRNDSNLFAQGKNLAYYEMLDMLKSGIDMYDFPLQNYGLDQQLEKLL